MTTTETTQRTRAALKQMAREDPELAARLVLQTLPAAAAQVQGPLAYGLTVDEVGAYRVAVADGAAAVVALPDGAASDGEVEFELETDARGLAEMAAGASPVWLMATRRLRVRGKRHRALRLRAMGAAEPTIADVARRGGKIDPDLLFRAMEYMIDPAWTRGHSFVVEYELTPSTDGAICGGRWFLNVRDGRPVTVNSEAPERAPDATVRMGGDVYRRLLTGELTPPQAAQRRLTVLEGSMYASTLVGRWMERSQGRDGAELERERRQRTVQSARAGTWGATNGAGRGATGAGQGDPGHASEGARRRGGELLSYGELYALWERQNWRAHELDFSVDREHWLAMPREAQESTIWSLGSFYVGEERVTADLAPFLLAAPTGEVEIFLATQLVDEARHAAFFDRFGAEVMALEAGELRGRMDEVERSMLAPWSHVFDDGLRDVANRVKAAPNDLDLFVEGIATYHVVIEGLLAMTGQRFIIKYMEDHGLYPGFVEGFSLVERDEHRHIAFGVRFLKEKLEEDRRYGEIVERVVRELVPRAVHVFRPPYADDPSDFTSYGYHSSHIYGYAYRTLKRRLSVIGLDAPPAGELMPGRLASPEEARAAGAPA